MWRTAMALACGMVLGAAGVVAVTRLTMAPGAGDLDEPGHQASPQKRYPLVKSGGRRDSVRLSALETRLQALERQATTSAATGADALEVELDEDARSSRELDLEEIGAAQQQTFQEWAAKLEEFERMPTERGKAAAQVEATLYEVMSPVAAQTGTTLERIQCRGSLCRASIQVPNYKAARERAPQFLYVDPGRPCESEVVLPPPEDQDVPYLAHVLYRCET